MTAPGPREWDADRYDALTLPHERWGAALLERLKLSGDEHVLDVGCGTGRDTAALLSRLPRGRVTAIDASAAMLRRLRERLAQDLERVTVLQADLAAPLPVERPVDAAFSVAALHWIGDHSAVFSNLAAVMAPRAQLVFECGGRGNIATVLDAVHRATGDDSGSIEWHFADPGDTERLLVSAGFEEVRPELREDPVRLPPAAPLRNFLRTVVLGAHLDRLDPRAHRDFVDAVVQAMEEPVVDYVRLQVLARRR